MCYYLDMNKSYVAHLEKQVQNFFLTTFENKGSITREEAQNFFVLFCNYILEKNGIDSRDIEIRFHRVKNFRGFEDPDAKQEIKKNELLDSRGRHYEDAHYKDDSGSALAFVKQDYKYDNKFDMYITNKISCPSMDYLGEFLDIVMTVAHECQHVVQYIVRPDDFSDYLDNLDSLNFTRMYLRQRTHNSKLIREIRHKIAKLQDAYYGVADIEVEAEAGAIRTLKGIFDSIQISPKFDDEFKDFIAGLLFSLHEIELGSKANIILAFEDYCPRIKDLTDKLLENFEELPKESEYYKIFGFANFY